MHGPLSAFLSANSVMLGLYVHVPLSGELDGPLRGVLAVPCRMSHHLKDSSVAQLRSQSFEHPTFEMRNLESAGSGWVN